MQNAYICKFTDEDRQTLDYINSLSFIKNSKRFSIIFIPVDCVFMLWSFYNKNGITGFISVFVLLLMLFLFFYPYIMKRSVKKNSEIRYGNGPVTNIVTFSDKIYVEAQDDRVTIEYSKIKKILDCGSIYALLFSSSGGTFFAKGSCPDASDGEILAFLQAKTGVKPKPAKSKSGTIITIVLTVISLCVSMLAATGMFLTGEKYTKAGVELIENEKYVMLWDTGMDYTVDYKDAYYQVHIQNGLFYDAGSVMIFTYTDDNYEKEKELVNSSFTFLDAPIPFDDSGTGDFTENDFIIPENEFSISTWNFKVCKSAEYEYPKYFRIIGFNDEKRQTAFLDFNGPDLDLTGESMQEFIDSYFDYKF